MSEQQSLDELLEQEKLTMQDLRGLASNPTPTEKQAALLARTETVRALLNKIQRPSADITAFCHNQCSNLGLLRNLKATQLMGLQASETRDRLIEVWSEDHKLRTSARQFSLPLEVLDHFVGCSTVAEIPNSVYLEVRSMLDEKVKPRLDDMCKTQCAATMDSVNESTTAAETERLAAMSRLSSTSPAPDLASVSSELSNKQKASVGAFKPEVDLAKAVTAAQTPSSSGKTSSTGEIEKEIVNGLSPSFAIPHGYRDPPSKNLLSMPEDLKLLGPAEGTKTSTLAFDSTSEAASWWSYAKTVGSESSFSAGGSAFGVDAGASLSRSKEAKAGQENSHAGKSREAVVLEVWIVPRHSFELHKSSMKLSEGAITDIKRCSCQKDYKEFIQQYGSHVPEGNYHLGGILKIEAHSVSDEETDTRSLLEAATSQLGGELHFKGAGVSVGASHKSDTQQQETEGTSTKTSTIRTSVTIEALGGSADRQNFVASLDKAANLRVIGKPSHVYSLHPVWELMKHSLDEAVRSKWRLFAIAYLKLATDLSELDKKALKLELQGIGPDPLQSSSLEECCERLANYLAGFEPSEQLVSLTQLYVEAFQQKYNRTKAEVLETLVKAPVVQKLSLLARFCRQSIFDLPARLGVVHVLGLEDLQNVTDHPDFQEILACAVELYGSQTSGLLTLLSGYGWVGGKFVHPLDHDTRKELVMSIAALLAPLVNAGASAFSPPTAENCNSLFLNPTGTESSLVAFQDCLRTGVSLDNLTNAPATDPADPWALPVDKRPLSLVLCEILQSCPLLVQETVITALFREHLTVPLLWSDLKHSSATALQLIFPFANTPSSLLDADVLKVLMLTNTPTGFAAPACLFGCRTLFEPEAGRVELGVGLLGDKELLFLHVHGGYVTSLEDVTSLVESADLILCETALDPASILQAQKLLQPLRLDRPASLLLFNAAGPFSTNPPKPGSKLRVSVEGAMSSGDAPACEYIRALLSSIDSNTPPLRDSLKKVLAERGLAMVQPDELPPENTTELRSAHLLHCLQHDDPTRRALNLRVFEQSLEAQRQGVRLCDVMAGLPHKQLDPAVSVANLVARQLLEGWSMELVDGSPNQPWLGVVFRRLEAMIGSQAKVAVVSAFGLAQDLKSTLFSKLFGVRLPRPSPSGRKAVTLRLVRAVGWAKFHYLVVLDQNGFSVPTANDAGALQDTQLLFESYGLSDVSLVLDSAAFFLPKLALATATLDRPHMPRLLLPGPNTQAVLKAAFTDQMCELPPHEEAGLPLDPIQLRRQIAKASRGQSIASFRLRLAAPRTRLAHASLVQKNNASRGEQQLSSAKSDLLERCDQVSREYCIPDPVPLHWSKEAKWQAAHDLITAALGEDTANANDDLSKFSLALKNQLQRRLVDQMNLADYDQQMIYYENLLQRYCDETPVTQLTGNFEELWFEMLVQARKFHPPPAHVYSGKGETFYSRFSSDKPRFLDLFAKGCQRAATIQRAVEALEGSLAGLCVPAVPTHREASESNPVEWEVRVRQALMFNPSAEHSAAPMKAYLKHLDTQTVLGKVTLKRLQSVRHLVPDLDAAGTAQVVTAVLSQLDFGEQYPLDQLQNRLRSADNVLFGVLSVPNIRLCPACLSVGLAVVCKAPQPLVTCQHCSNTFCACCLMRTPTAHQKCSPAQRQQLPATTQ